METENIDARNAIESTIKSNRKIILELLSSISNFCGKEVDFDNIKATPPSFLFDKLKSAEQYDNQHDMKFKNTAKKLKEFLISKIEDILQKAITFLNHGHADRECEESSSSNNLSSLRVVNTVSDGQDSHSTPHGVNYNISTLEDCEDLVKRVEMFTPYLPADLYEVYRSKLLEIKNLVEIARKAHASRIEEAINSTTDHYRKGFRLFYNYKERGNFHQMKDIGDVLNKLLCERYRLYLAGFDCQRSKSSVYLFQSGKEGKRADRADNNFPSDKSALILLVKVLSILLRTSPVSFI